MAFLLLGGSLQVLPQFGEMEGHLFALFQGRMEKSKHSEAAMHRAVYILKHRELPCCGEKAKSKLLPI